MTERAPGTIPRYEQIAGTLRWFSKDIYRPGKMLPPEKDLIDIFRRDGETLSRGTMRHALDILVAEKVLETRKGVGTFVKHLGEAAEIVLLGGTVEDIEREFPLTVNTMAVLSARMGNSETKAALSFKIPRGAKTKTTDTIGYLETAWAGRSLKFSEDHPDISLSQLQAVRLEEAEATRESMNGTLLRIRLLQELATVDGTIAQHELAKAVFGESYDPQKTPNILRRHLQSLQDAGLITLEANERGKPYAQFAVNEQLPSGDKLPSSRPKLAKQILSIITPDENDNIACPSPFTYEGLYESLCVKHPEMRLVPNIPTLYRRISVVVSDLVKAEYIKSIGLRKGDMKRIHVPETSRLLFAEYASLIEEFMNGNRAYLDESIVLGFDIVRNPKRLDKLLAKAKATLQHTPKPNSDVEITVVASEERQVVQAEKRLFSSPEEFAGVIVGLIDSGKLPSGYVLPLIKELTSITGHAHPFVRQTLRQLASEGYLTKKGISYTVRRTGEESETKPSQSPRLQSANQMVALDVLSQLQQCNLHAGDPIDTVELRGKYNKSQQAILPPLRFLADPDRRIVESRAGGHGGWFIPNTAPSPQKVQDVIDEINSSEFGRGRRNRRTEHEKRKKSDVETFIQALWTYRRVAKVLQARIEDRTYPSTDPLPTPETIAGEFGVDIRVTQSAVWHLVRTGQARVEKIGGTLIVTPLHPDKRAPFVEDDNPIHQQYKRIAWEILKKILSGEYQPGQRLPTMNVLAEEFRVSTVPIVQAMELLGGLVARKHGHGIWITNQHPDDALIAKIKQSDMDAPPLGTGALDLLFTDENYLRKTVYYLYRLIFDGELPPGGAIPQNLDWSHYPGNSPVTGTYRRARAILRELDLVDIKIPIGASVVNPLPSTLYMEALGKALLSTTESKVKATRKPRIAKEKRATASKSTRKRKTTPADTDKTPTDAQTTVKIITSFSPRRSEIIDLAAPPGAGLREPDEEEPWAVTIRERGDTPLEEITTHLRRPPAFIANLLGINIADEVNEIRTRRFVQTTSTTYLHNVDYYYVPVDWLSEIEISPPNYTTYIPLINIQKINEGRNLNHQIIQQNAVPALAQMFDIPDGDPLLVNIFTYLRSETPKAPKTPFAVRILTQARNRGAKTIFVRT